MLRKRKRNLTKKMKRKLMKKSSAHAPLGERNLNLPKILAAITRRRKRRNRVAAVAATRTENINIRAIHLTIKISRIIES
jgi:hypothetical protein